MITPLHHVHKTVPTEGDEKGLLQMRAQTSWFSDHLEPVQSVNYKSQSLTNETKIYHSGMSGGTTEDTFWHNLLDVSYWSEESESWQELLKAENEEVKTTQLATEARLDATNVESVCPERRPVVFTEDGQRQVPQELYNMASQVIDKSKNTLPSWCVITLYTTWCILPICHRPGIQNSLSVKPDFVFN